LVAGIDPTDGETGVLQDEGVTIVFSEAMDESSAAGRITL
jgi:hypothetical protein